MNTLLTQDAATPPDNSTREIILVQGGIAVVDAADYEWLNRHRWHLSSLGYARRCAKGNKHILMHREILGTPRGIFVDHRDGNPLNNTRANLRVATNSQNQMNRKMARSNKSGYKGVIWRADRKRWKAYLHINKKQIFIGLFKDKHEAAKAYNAAATKLYGEFAHLNQV